MSSLTNILFSPISSFLKLQKHTVDALKRLGIYDARDLLLYKPNSYDIVTICTPESEAKLEHGSHVIVEVTVKEIERSRTKRGPIKIYTESSAGAIVLIFFNAIPTFIFNKLTIGSKHVVEGKIELHQGFYFQISHPNFLLNKNQIKEIQPIYPLTYGITNKQLYGYILRVIEELDIVVFSSAQTEYLSPRSDGSDPKSLILLLKSLHIPHDIKSTSLDVLIKSLAKWELLANQIKLAAIRNQLNIVRGRAFLPFNGKDKILDKLGFTLTESQFSALREIELDQGRDHRMIRMLHGDVGSGKTLVALLTMMNVSNTGVQSVLMAPTDLLANQHFEFFKKALDKSSITLALLTGKTKAKEKKIIQDNLENGGVLILIGTHAAFQEKVNFKDLGYVVIDEQHRFGVEQRMELINKATTPDLLVMTATPIPRSLSLTLFGDMSTSKLISKPQGRLPIVTCVISKTHINEVIDALRRKIDKGEKIYWICPLIEKQELDDNNEKLMDVATRYDILNFLYPNQVGFIHGAMKNDQKDQAMQSFKNGNIKILVATTVIEVGIDVPDATLIIIENAEKFGLAQLHQLRGRVGRSALQSHAILLYEPSRCSTFARKRMEIMRTSDDGFYISEQDLVLRGGGEILGVKQSGAQEFIFADLARDMELLNECNKLALKSVTNQQDHKFLIELFSQKRMLVTKEILE